MAEASATFERRLLREAAEVLSDIMGGVVGHFIITKVEETTGKKQRKLNLRAIRQDAPYFVKTLADEAEFNRLVVRLESALQKSLEIWMANSLGDHQRADVILTIVNMNRGGHKVETDEGRKDAIAALKAIAEIPFDLHKSRRAVAFRIMKSHESEYIGSQITGSAKEFLIQAYAEGIAWAEQFAADVDKHTDRILNGLRVRENYGIVRGFFSAISRSLALPWETQETLPMNQQDLDRQFPSERGKRNEDRDCGSSNPRRSKWGLNFCFRGIKVHFDGVVLDAGVYHQRAKQNDDNSGTSNQ